MRSGSISGSRNILGLGLRRSMKKFVVLKKVIGLRVLLFLIRKILGQGRDCIPSYPLEQFAKDLKTEKEKKQEEAEMMKEATRRRRDYP